MIHSIKIACSSSVAENVLWRNLIWATFCIKQKCVQIPPYLWCISYIILFLYPLSKSHKKLEVLKHSEEWEQSLDNLKKIQNSVLTHVERLGRWHSLSPMLSFVYANWMARETTLELSCYLWMNLGCPIDQHGPSYVLLT